MASSRRIPNSRRNSRKRVFKRFLLHFGIGGYNSRKAALDPSSLPNRLRRLRANSGKVSSCASLVISAILLASLISSIPGLRSGEISADNIIESVIWTQAYLFLNLVTFNRR